MPLAAQPPTHWALKAVQGVGDRVQIPLGSVLSLLPPEDPHPTAVDQTVLTTSGQAPNH